MQSGPLSNRCRSFQRPRNEKLKLHVVTQWCMRLVDRWLSPIMNGGRLEGRSLTGLLSSQYTGLRIMYNVLVFYYSKNIYIQIIVCTAVALLIYDVIGAGRLRPTSFHLEMYPQRLNRKQARVRVWSETSDLKHGRMFVRQCCP